MKPYCGQKEYDPKDMIALKNPEQSARIAQYAYLYDTLLSGKKLVFLFNRKEIEPYLEKWRNFELE